MKHPINAPNGMWKFPTSTMVSFRGCLIWNEEGLTLFPRKTLFGWGEISKLLVQWMNSLLKTHWNHQGELTTYFGFAASPPSTSNHNINHHFFCSLFPSCLAPSAHLRRGRVSLSAHHIWRKSLTCAYVGWCWDRRTSAVSKHTGLIWIGKHIVQNLMHELHGLTWRTRHDSVKTPCTHRENEFALFTKSVRCCVLFRKYRLLDGL
jgi:hypothetical protein